MINYEPLKDRYVNNLANNKKAYDYLLSRHLTHDVIRDFELGYSMSNIIESKAKEVIDCGLVKRYEDGVGTFFNNRIMIPIRDNNGKLAGFTGRTMLTFDGISKYKNSVESKQFDKSSILFNLHAIGDNNSVIISEAQLNTLAYTQFIRQSVFSTNPHPVSTGGTALTKKHVEALTDSGVDTVFLAFDGDKAGREATLKAINLLKGEFTLFIVRMPKDTDMMDLLPNYDIIEKIVMFESMEYREYVRLLAGTYKKTYMDRLKKGVRVSIRDYENSLKRLSELSSVYFRYERFTDGKHSFYIDSVDEFNNEIVMVFDIYNVKYKSSISYFNSLIENKKFWRV